MVFLALTVSNSKAALAVTPVCLQLTVLDYY